jgi:hypothetical protein
MTTAARILAILAATTVMALVATPATASASIGGTFCTVAGWLSGVAGKVCTVASHAGGVLDAGKKLAGGHVGGAIGALTGSASQSVARVAGTVAIVVGVIAAAHEALKLTVNAIGATTTPNLNALWFSSSYWRMAAVAALLTVPFLFAAAIQAMLHSDLSLLMRAALGYLPLGLLAVGVAAPLTALLLAGSDEMSSIVSSASGHAGAGALGRLGGAGLAVSGLSGSTFVTFFIALFTIAAAFTLWLELLIRQAAVYVIVLMLPLFFAAMVWPARRIWAVRVVELLVALILSKFAIVAVLGLGGAALGHTLLPGIPTILAGTTLVLLAAFSPWALLRLLPLHELAGAAVGGLRPHAGLPFQATDKRAYGATEAAEDRAGAEPSAGEAAGGQTPSADVAAGLPARLRAFTLRDGPAGPDDPEEQGTSPSHAVGDDEDVSAGGETPAPSPGTGVSEPEAPPPMRGSESGLPPSGPETTSTPAPVPGYDAFGSTARHGELPAVFQNMSLDADVLALDQRFPTGDAASPLPELPTAPPAPAEAQDTPE